MNNNLERLPLTDDYIFKRVIKIHKIRSMDVYIHTKRRGDYVGKERE